MHPLGAMSDPLVALTVAGADPAGGAGLAADLRTFATLGAHGTFALTVVTAQDTTGVHRAVPLPVDLVVDQVTAVAGDLTIAALKTGLLIDPDVIRSLARLVGEVPLPAPVVDPVLADRHGRPLGGDDVVAAYLDELVPLARVVTPNVHEARLLTGLPVVDAAGMAAAARVLVERGAAAAMITGGALEGADVIDVICYAGEVIELRRPRVDTGNDHGTGDTLSAALAVRLGAGDDLVTAARTAVEVVDGALRGAVSWRLGAGHGPLDQLGWNR